MAHEAGKGSRPRPFSVSQAEYDSRWDAIFGRDGLDDKKPNPEREERHTRNNAETQAVKENNH